MENLEPAHKDGPLLKMWLC